MDFIVSQPPHKNTLASFFVPPSSTQEISKCLFAETSKSDLQNRFSRGGWQIYQPVQWFMRPVSTNNLYQEILVEPNITASRHRPALTPETRYCSSVSWHPADTVHHNRIYADATVTSADPLLMTNNCSLPAYIA